MTTTHDPFRRSTDPKPRPSMRAWGRRGGAVNVVIGGLGKAEPTPITG